MPRWSKSYAMPGGGHAIVCGSSPARRCSNCGSWKARQLCDHVVGYVFLPGKPVAGELTCDKPLCLLCRVRVGDRDLCPDHPKGTP